MSGQAFRWWITQAPAPLGTSGGTGRFWRIGGGDAPRCSNWHAHPNDYEHDHLEWLGNLHTDLRREGASQGCATGCHLLSGPYPTPAVAASFPAKAARVNPADAGRALP